ncbi:MarR family winged helix-turn-helix transcriptional regulator [Oceanicoccus sp. KOV_DT_Chl]|uniref:MarR family winged helix-turn-helix transcriptional regulator n=1 Tax=Oceanicoccus sp. KOV_DT_Chl TaxID=1904639 RepID=UPI000C7A1F4C|nr:MarR family winged helix-turn-helix transcriptional regulator [Oceanicoccus sp. KOV_DT_Chl]
MSSSKIPDTELPLGVSQSVDLYLLPYLMNRLANKVNQLWLQELRPQGLTIQRWQVLSILMVMDGSRVGVLAEMAGAEQAVLSRVIDQMQRDGLVRRKVAAKDSRVKEVRITRQGREIYRRLLPKATAHVDRLTNSIGPDKAGRLVGELEQMLAKLS